MHEHSVNNDVDMRESHTFLIGCVISCDTRSAVGRVASLIFRTGRLTNRLKETQMKGFKLYNNEEDVYNEWRVTEPDLVTSKVLYENMNLIGSLHLNTVHEVVQVGNDVSIRCQLAHISYKSTWCGKASCQNLLPLSNLHRA